MMSETRMAVCDRRRPTRGWLTDCLLCCCSSRLSSCVAVQRDLCGQVGRTFCMCCRYLQTTDWDELLSVRPLQRATLPVTAPTGTDHLHCATVRW
jgi:hypothetical protein